MTYRDDILALGERERTLRAALTSVEAELAMQAAREVEAERLRSALTALEAEQRGASAMFLGLHPLHVKKPCRVPWSSMQGGEHVRHCARCERNVYSLSGLTSVQAARILAEREHGGCVRFFARADGTLITSDCSVAQPPRLTSVVRVAAVVAGLGAASMTTHTQPDPPPCAVLQPKGPIWSAPAPQPPPVTDEVAPPPPEFSYSVAKHLW